MKLKTLRCFVALFFILQNTTPIFGNEIVPPTLDATAAILIDVNTGVILYENNAHEQRYPASLTKLMTALMLLEHAGDDLTQRITMSHDAVFSIPRGSSHIAMNEGETLTISEALYAIMLESANEVSNAIAEHISGDIDTFAELMTVRARQLGALNTNFTNAHGLHGPEHFTTAYDMALITKELITHPYFVDVINTRMHHIPPTELQPLERPLNNTHRMIHPGGQFFNPYVVGGKTGFTNEASHTLSTYASRGNARLVTVVMQTPRLATFTDTQMLLDFGFDIYDNLEVATISDFTKEIHVANTYSNEYDQSVMATASLRTPIQVQLPPTITIDDINLVPSIQPNLAPPILVGQAVGTVTAMYGNTPLATVDLISQTHIPSTIVPATATDIANQTAPEEPQANIIFTNNFYTVLLPDNAFFNFVYNFLTLRNIGIAALGTICSIIFVRLMRFVRYLMRRQYRRKRHSAMRRASRLQPARVPQRGNARYKYSNNSRR